MHSRHRPRAERDSITRYPDLHRLPEKNAASMGPQLSGPFQFRLSPSFSEKSNGASDLLDLPCTSSILRFQ